MADASQDRPGPREFDAAEGGRRWPSSERLAGNDEALSLCGASGWALRRACTDGQEHAICPVCSRRVRTRPGSNARLPLRIVVEHAR
jgi:hypothetical protein